MTRNGRLKKYFNHYASSIFFDKRLGTEVAADNLGEEFKGYVLKIGGGNDKQGFPMK